MNVQVMNLKLYEKNLLYLYIKILLKAGKINMLKNVV